MKHNPHALINVQALSEPQRAKHRRKVYSCYKAVIDKTPDQLKSDFAPWSSRAIREYVRRAYGMSISRRTARRYMQKMGREGSEHIDTVSSIQLIISVHVPDAASSGAGGRFGRQAP